jgi:hypothetical protein
MEVVEFGGVVTGGRTPFTPVVLTPPLGTTPLGAPPFCTTPVPRLGGGFQRLALFWQPPTATTPDSNSPASFRNRLFLISPISPAKD